MTAGKRKRYQTKINPGVAQALDGGECQMARSGSQLRWMYRFTDPGYANRSRE